MVVLESARDGLKAPAATATRLVNRAHDILWGKKHDKMEILETSESQTSIIRLVHHTSISGLRALRAQTDGKTSKLKSIEIGRTNDHRDPLNRMISTQLFICSALISGLIFVPSIS